MGGVSGTNNKTSIPSGPNSSQVKDASLDQLMEILKAHTSEECYKRAQDLKKTIPSENLDYLTSFLESLVKHLGNQHQAGLYPAMVMKTKKVFLIVQGQTHGAHQQLLDQLNAQGPRVRATDNLEQCDAVLLFCPVRYRVGSDVETAVKNIPDGAQGKPVVLILMHHTRKPDQLLDQTQWSNNFPAISVVVQVLFHQTKNGLLPCPRNEEAVQTLQSMCDFYMNTKTSEDKWM